MHAPRTTASQTLTSPGYVCLRGLSEKIFLRRVNAIDRSNEDTRMHVEYSAVLDRVLVSHIQMV